MSAALFSFYTQIQHLAHTLYGAERKHNENHRPIPYSTHLKQNIIVDCVLFYAPILNASRTLKCLSLSSDSTHLMIAVLLLVPLLLLLLSALFSVICRFLTVSQLKWILFGMLFFVIFFRFVHLPFFLRFWTFGSRKWICSCCRNIIFLDLLSFFTQKSLYLFSSSCVYQTIICYILTSKKTFSTAFALILISRVFQCIFFFLFAFVLLIFASVFLLARTFRNCSYASAFTELFPFTRNKISNISRIYYQSTASNGF